MIHKYIANIPYLQIMLNILILYHKCVADVMHVFVFFLVFNKIQFKFVILYIILTNITKNGIFIVIYFTYKKIHVQF